MCCGELDGIAAGRSVPRLRAGSAAASGGGTRAAVGGAALAALRRCSGDSAPPS
jgi:hypothetical protein